ncbi:achaete-scute homolog 5-like [Seriola lalandi dorsalis]|uniref:Achaete-scute family bHLH transcription factor 5 n=1 Tax=Seriola lalandi dorsalis TaxID=1841481 RepID=A0A3B4YJN8_SERLL|nr:achaete-scute homolog 5-like [Seriola lalandi dorsalis]XP_056256887.1 achaete-scute homolog 5-like [Seriola aureovittata]
MMSSSFSPPIIDQRSSYLSFSLSPAAGLREDRGVSQPSDSLSGSVPFFFYPSSMDPTGFSLYKGPLRGPGPGLLPYLTPFHHHGHFSVYECPFEPAFIQKRNERERQRVKCVNQGYAKLRDHLPGHSADKRLSKVETLRAAIRYIKYLQGLVEPEDGRHSGGESPDTSSPGPDCGGESEGLTC